MQTVTLAKALKLKNRITGRLSRLRDTVGSYNSQKSSSERVDVRPVWELHNRLTGYLIELKSAIHAGNTPIAGKIAAIQETKGAVDWVRKLDTFHGRRMEYLAGGNYGEVEFEADLRLQEVTGIIGELEADLDRLQDEVDAHNASTKITVPDGLFEPGVLTDAPKKAA